MGVEEIPKAYLYTCDACGLTHMQKHANGQYRDSRPPHWARLRIGRDAEDFQGAAVADASIERLLCADCSSAVFHTINISIEARKKKDP